LTIEDVETEAADLAAKARYWEARAADKSATFAEQSERKRKAKKCRDDRASLLAIVQPSLAL
jgi:hypothetical protein